MSELYHFLSSRGVKYRSLRQKLRKPRNGWRSFRPEVRCLTSYPGKIRQR